MVEQNATERPRVLVVDDEVSIADTLAAIVQNEGYETAVAYTGEAAIETARRFRPHFLLSDIKMPGMSGIEAAIAILNFLPDLSVLFISGHAVADDVLAGARAKGFTFEVCNKPIAPLALLNKINEMSRPWASKPTTILNVDDDRINRYAISRILRQAGFQVLEAATGEEALREARSGPDLILLDINLPDISGFEVLRQLKASPETAKIPVVHLTATSVDEESRAKALRLGAADYFTHPIDPEPLVSALRKFAGAKFTKPD